MNILQMSIQAGMLITAIIIIRAVALNRLPKTVFLVLWGVVLVRLLVPFTFSSRFSIYTLINNVSNHTVTDHTTLMINQILPMEQDAAEQAKTITEAIQPQAVSSNWPVWIWIAGMIAAISFFGILYIKSYQELQFATPLCHDFIDKWFYGHKLRRPLAIMQTDRITTPIAAGIMRPRIILPKTMDLSDNNLLQYVLTHEYFHIRRFDVVWKLIMIAALCLHWYNPLVWVMFILADRDLEITCDELVVRQFGADNKAAYAYSIISIAEQRSKLMPLHIGFSKNSAEERITAIMKYKKSSVIAIVLAAFLVIGMTTAFALSAAATTPSKNSGVPANSNKNNNTTKQTVLPGNNSANPVLDNVPLQINYSRLEYDDSEYHWPMNMSSVTNIGDKNILNYEMAYLAYDKDGNPLELYWDARNVAANGEVGSVGNGFDGVDYGIVTDIFPISPKSYQFIYMANPTTYLPDIEETLLDESKKVEWNRKMMDLPHIKERQFDAETKEWDDKTMKDQIIKPGDVQINGSNLFDGWDQNAGEHKVAYIISCIKTITFEDDTVWENPEYQNWLSEYEGKSIGLKTLNAYYK